MSAKFNTSSLHAEDLNRNAGDVHGAAHKDIAIPVPGKHDCCHLPDITGLRAQIIDNFTVLAGSRKHYSENSEFKGAKYAPIHIVTLGEAPMIRAAVFFGLSTLQVCSDPASTTAGALQKLLKYTELKIERNWAIIVKAKDPEGIFPDSPPSTPKRGKHAKVSNGMHNPHTSTLPKGIHIGAHMYNRTDASKSDVVNDEKDDESSGIPVEGMKTKNEATDYTKIAASIDAANPRVLPSIPNPIPTIYADPPKTPTHAVKKKTVAGLNPEYHDHLWSPSFVNNPNFKSNVEIEVEVEVEDDDDDDDDDTASMVCYDGYNDGFSYTYYAKENLVTPAPPPPPNRGKRGNRRTFRERLF